MVLPGIPLFQALADKMRWHEARQGVLAQNIANADTPNFVERDLSPYSFGDTLKSTATLTVATTSPMHLQASSGGGSGAFDSQSSPFEVTPSGNGVTLEDEMMKVAGNDMDYQAVTALYQRSIGILRMAIDKNG
jgi:flagellar basal-body rod protein FlgB